MRIKFYDDTKRIKDDNEYSKDYIIGLLEEDLKGEHEAIDLYNKHIELMKKVKAELEEKIKKEHNDAYTEEIKTIDENIIVEEHIRDEEMEHVRELEERIEYTKQ